MGFWDLQSIIKNEIKRSTIQAVSTDVMSSKI